MIVTPDRLDQLSEIWDAKAADALARADMPHRTEAEAARHRQTARECEVTAAGYRGRAARARRALGLLPPVPPAPPAVSPVPESLEDRVAAVLRACESAGPLIETERVWELLAPGRDQR